MHRIHPAERQPQCRGKDRSEGRARVLALDSDRAAEPRSIADTRRIRSRRYWFLEDGREPAHRDIAIPSANLATVLRGGVAATRNMQIVTALRHSRGGTHRIRDAALRG